MWSTFTPKKVQMMCFTLASVQKYVNWNDKPECYKKKSKPNRLLFFFYSYQQSYSYNTY